MFSKTESNSLTAILRLEPGTSRLEGAVFSLRSSPWHCWVQGKFPQKSWWPWQQRPWVCHCTTRWICSHGLSTGTEVWTALPRQWWLLLEWVSKVLGWHQETGRLGQVDWVACGIRRGWWGHQAAWLCSGKGEPSDGAPCGAGAGGRAGLPRRCPEVRGGQDHGKGLRLIGAEREADWLLRGLLGSQAGAAINSH